ncbi:M67 family metallopeptidase [Sphingomonas donggukensis]|uniref:M67 family metallopeptidase n=2 Tax=Sphingomonas donggukensis TaxID=2949093 RepID=A0ABY4TX41_9SPHN|nr:M67 family metallopeptidase [Sphingomonas donggukensis]URW76961.1 M67 family metallopeptidase [Sphingomonas donggukensis]
MTLRISRSVADAILAEARAGGSREVCGLLFGSATRIDTALRCANVAETPHRAFEIDSAALLAAHRAARGGGPRIAGCYHSHPSGTATPSLRDAAAAAPDGWLWVIAGGGALAAFRAVAAGAIHGRFDPVPLVIDEG